MEAETFWDRIWKTAERVRLAASLDRCDPPGDVMLRLLKERGAATVCDAGCGCGAFSLRLAEAGFSEEAHYIKYVFKLTDTIGKTLWLNSIGLHDAFRPEGTRRI